MTSERMVESIIEAAREASGDRVIWKFPLRVVAADQVLPWPEWRPYLEPVHFEIALLSDGSTAPHVWWLMGAESEEPEAMAPVMRIVGTGHWFPPPSTYVGTERIGEFVWHLILTGWRRPERSSL
jgi:hypothetical protein